MRVDIYQPAVTSWPCRHPALLEGFVAAQPGGLPSKCNRAFINHQCPGAARGPTLWTLLPCEGKQQTRKSDLQPRPSSLGAKGMAAVTAKHAAMGMTGSAAAEGSSKAQNWHHSFTEAWLGYTSARHKYMAGVVPSLPIYSTLDLSLPFRCKGCLQWEGCISASQREHSPLKMQHCSQLSKTSYCPKEETQLWSGRPSVPQSPKCKSTPPVTWEPGRWCYTGMPASLPIKGEHETQRGKHSQLCSHITRIRLLQVDFFLQKSSF